MQNLSGCCVHAVIRRVGGLEEPRERNLALEVVIRRVGGLEVTSGPARIPAAVIRRVGGLENFPASLFHS